MKPNVKVSTFLSIVLIVVIISIMTLLFSSDDKREDLLIATAQNQSFSIELNLIGILDAAKSHMISSALEATSGTIIYLIEDGKMVKKDELLVRFDDSAIKKEVAQYQAEVESYTAAVSAAEQIVAFEKSQVEREIAGAHYNKNVAALELKRLEEGEGPLKISTLNEELQRIKSELKRYQSFMSDLNQLKDKGFDNPSEITSTKDRITVLQAKLDSAQKRYQSYKLHVLPALIESAKAKVQNSELIVQQTIQGGKHKIAKTKAGLLQVKGVLETKKSSLDKVLYILSQTEIRAPFEGIVIHYITFRDGEKRKPREGDSVFINQPILYLPDISKMIVKSKARETDLHKIRLGQKCVFHVDAYPDARLTGVITFIGSLATAEDDGKTHGKFFQVEFKVDQTDLRLRPGMTSRISISSDQVKAALTIPIQAVFTDEQDTICYIRKRNGTFEKRVITIGRQNEDYVEITGGLQEGDKVSLIRRTK